MNSIETVAKNIRLEVMQYAFFHLFPVAVAGTAMIMDIRTAKVDNGWIIFSMSVGLFVCIWQKNITGIGFFIMGSVMPLFLMILFAFGMIGAGDIKLFCALGGIMGCESIIKCIFISFLTGAGISAALLIFNHNFCERILYFIEYVKCTVSTLSANAQHKSNADSITTAAGGTRNPDAMAAASACASVLFTLSAIKHAKFTPSLMNKSFDATDLRLSISLSLPPKTYSI